MPANTDVAGSGKGFFAALFDFSFTTFVTPKIVKVLYILITVGLALIYLALVVSAFANNGGAGVLVLIFGALGYLVYLAFARVVLEFYMAVFRIADDVQAMRRRG
ncbi:MAG: DUF4282 domain-containing protein [Actinomycetota bacterium]|nr:DUF4282 domain-containing protein [Actinomycetota bacterium]